MMDAKMRNLDCRRLEMDEIWGYIWKKEKHLRADAWMYHTDDPAHPKRHVTVLHIPPVTSPKTAVQAAIVQEYEDRAVN
jgi:hypothetical protein